MHRRLAWRLGLTSRATNLCLLGTMLGLGAGFSAACSSSKTSDNGGDGGPSVPPFGTLPIAGDDVDPPSSVTLNSDVVIVHGGLSTLKSVSTDHGTWTLDKSASGVSNLAVGKILLLAGLDVARVTALEDMGDTVDVTVTPVAITDLIVAGDYSWDNLTIDPANGTVIQAPEALELETDTSDAGASDAAASDGGDSDGGASPKIIPGPHTLGITSPTGEISFTVGNWKVLWNASRSGTGVDIKVEATVNGASSGSSGGITSLGSISGTVNVTTHINNVSGSSGSLSVSGSKLNGSSLSVPMDGTVNVGFTATTPKGSQFPGSALVKLPLAIEYPVPCWGGIPCYLSFQANLLFQPSLSTINSGFQLNSSIVISGTSGFSFKNGSASPTSSPSVTPPTTSPLDTLVTIPSAGATAMVASIEAPRIGFGVGTLSFALGIKAGIFVDAINSFGIVVAPVTSLVPCREVDWKFSASAGGEMSIQLWKGASVSLEQSATLYTYPTTGTHNWYTPAVSACKP